MDDFLHCSVCLHPHEGQILFCRSGHKFCLDCIEQSDVKPAEGIMLEAYERACPYCKRQVDVRERLISVEDLRNLVVRSDIKIPECDLNVQIPDEITTAIDGG